MTLSETCSTVAYDPHVLYQNATQMIHEEATRRLGTGYTLLGEVTVSVIHTTITDQTQGIATLTMKLDATYIYQLSEGMKQHIVHLIAGKSKQRAMSALLQVPGIQEAAITIKGNATTVPQDPGNIHITVVYRSASL